MPPREPKPGQSLEDLLPDLADQWSSKNTLYPSCYGRSSSSEVWWICSLGHEWLSSINNRARGKGCPYCTGKRILIGFNDLGTTNPSLALEWSERNMNGPESYTKGSNKRVWWICSKGHEWQAYINNRSSGNGCPTCRNNLGAEARMRDHLSVIFGPTEDRFIPDCLTRFGNKIEVDYFRDRTIVEYDGGRWHESAVATENDVYKTKLFLENGYRVIRLRENKLPFLEITHPELIQVRVRWDKSGDNIRQTLVNLFSGR